MNDTSLQAAAEILRSAEALLITAGAGLGVDSGLPDFRGTTGFWKAYPPYAKLGIEFHDLACPDTLHDDPALFWGFYEHRRVLYRDTEPHAGYRILRNLADIRPSFVFTSNVDGHFARAGFSRDQIVECHGTIHSRQCAGPCRNDIWTVNDEGLTIDSRTMRANGPFPECPRCGGLTRPNVLLFGDDTWVDARTADQFDRYRTWQRSLRGARLAVLELGAGMALPTVRHEGEHMAARHHGTLIRVNPREFSTDSPTAMGLQGNALEALTAISELLGLRA